jgi:hypothetical protein
LHRPPQPVTGRLLPLLADTGRRPAFIDSNT